MLSARDLRREARRSVRRALDAMDQALEAKGDVECIASALEVALRHTQRAEEQLIEARTVAICARWVPGRKGAAR